MSNIISIDNFENIKKNFFENIKKNENEYWTKSHYPSQLSYYLLIYYMKVLLT